MNEVLIAVKQHGRSINTTGRMLFKASPKFFFVLVLAAGIVGVGGPYTLIVFGDLMDALVGARGVGFVTSDTTSSGSMLLFMILLLVGGAIILGALRGGAKRWCLQLTELIGVIILLVIALPAALIRLPIQMIATLLPGVYKIGRWQMLIMAFIILAFLTNAPEILDTTARQQITLGQFILFMSADVLLTLWSLLKLSPYSRKKPSVG